MIKFIKACWDEDKQRWALWVPVLFALGIGFYFSLSFEPSKWLTLGVIELLVVLAILFRHNHVVLKFFAALSIIVAGFTLIQVKTIWLNGPAYNIPEETSYYKGKVVSVDTNYQGRLRFVLSNLTDYDNNTYHGLYRITQRNNNQKVALGECIEFVGRISPLPTEVIVGGYQFDRKGYFEGLKGSGFAESRWFKTQCNTKENLSLVSYIGNLRQKIVSRINNILPPDEASVASAIIAGERGGISQEQYEWYRNSGLAHFLSISGLHMSMLAGLMFFLIRFILAVISPIALRIDTKKVAAVFAIILSSFYLLISGYAIPAQRAYIMTFIVLLGVLTNRRAISLNTIALAAFVVLCISPQVLVSASFQMSFAAVLGLIAFYEKIAGRISSFLNTSGVCKYLRVLFLYILGVIVSDFIASLMTLPFAIYHFNMIAIYTTLGNFLAGPIIGLVIMPFMLLSLLFMPIGLDVIFLKIVGGGIDMINHITMWISSLPNAGLQVSSMPHWGLIFIVVGGLWLMLWQAKWRYWGLILIAFGFLSLTFVKIPDIIIAPELKAFAFKNSKGELEIVSSRGGRFAKNIWQNKYHISSSKTHLQAHPELQIKDNIVSIKGQSFDINKAIGANIYFATNNIKIKTIRQDIGYRHWNDAL